MSNVIDDAIAAIAARERGMREASVAILEAVLELDLPKADRDRLLAALRQRKVI